MQVLSLLLRFPSTSSRLLRARLIGLALAAGPTTEGLYVSAAGDASAPWHRWTPWHREPSVIRSSPRSALAAPLSATSYRDH